MTQQQAMVKINKINTELAQIECKVTQLKNYENQVWENRRKWESMSNDTYTKRVLISCERELNKIKNALNKLEKNYNKLLQKRNEIMASCK